LNDIISKNGKRYVKQKNQNHRVCECNIVLRNCIKCNINLAKRESDYITLMVKHARESSIDRQIKRPSENHYFDTKIFYQKIFDRISQSGMLCECIECIGNENRQKMSVRGPNKLSMDRIYDNIGYTHVNQRLRLVAKSHHSWQKRNSVPQNVVAKKKKWIQYTKDSILKRSKYRYDRMLSEINEMENSGMNTNEMKSFLSTHLIDGEQCKIMLHTKMESISRCEKCEKILDYGDKNGYLVTKNNPYQASPDRINNRMGYIPSNTRIVCCSCQTMGDVDEPDDIFLNDFEKIKLLKYITSKIDL